MAARKRTISQRARDLAITAEMYIAGETQAAIAKRIGVSRPMITRDLKEIQRYWKENTAIDLDAYKTAELAKLDLMEAECWDAWEASKNPTTITEARDTKAGQYPGKSAMKREISSAGDPRFLDALSRCITLRSKLLGLDAPIKLDATHRETYKFSEVFTPAEWESFTKTAYEEACREREQYESTKKKGKS